jgi:hypothetical protein
MGSINQDRTKVDSPARPIWFLQDKSEKSLFLGNVRTHLITWPSAGFDIAKFSRNISPWHSAAFADTEIALKMSMTSRIKHLNVVTMHYMENPESESHSLPNPEKYVGAALGLIRVFSEIEFYEFTGQIQESLRGEFSSQLSGAIHARLGKSGLSNFVVLFAQEKLNEIWGYTEPITLDTLSKLYQDLDGQRTSRLLAEISRFVSEEDIRIPIVRSDNAIGEEYKKHEWQSILPRPNNAPIQRYSAKRLAKAATKKVISVAPRGYRMKLRILVIKILIRFNPGHPWNFK